MMLRTLVAMLSVVLGSRVMAGERIQRIEPNVRTGIASAVVVSHAALIHTEQIFAQPDAAGLKRQSAAAQLRNIMEQARSLLTIAHASEIVKVNLYAVSDTVAAELWDEFPTVFIQTSQPAVSMVVTHLPVADALVGVDFVACQNAGTQASYARNTQFASLPSGVRIYVSGQAEQSESLAEATRNTLESLHRTLEFLGRSDDDIVQLKAFVTPMSDFAVVRAEVQKFFEGKLPPPLVLVEWESTRLVPIEIELIAAGGSYLRDAPSMEFLTPPGMKASPVYCRVCRINHPSTVYVSGLYSTHDRIANPDATANGDLEVENIFVALRRILNLAGSDFSHLAKATYYVSTEAASTSLNKLRPALYDPSRPPAASKAFVGSTGIETLGLTLDMIAVPTTSPSE